jgi:predicted Zn-dependent protease
LLLGDVQTFADPAAARTAYGLSGDIAVAAVAAGSPAEAAGLAANMVVTAVAGTAVGPAPRRGSWDRIMALQARLEQAAARDGEVALTLEGGRLVTIKAAPSCGVRFILDDAKNNAAATRSQVRIGREALAQLGGDEAMIAAVLAHELAHAALDHETVLGPGRWTTAAVRRTEREADRLSVWIMANAGYDPAAALRMIYLIAPRGILVIPGPSHGKASTRAREMAAEIAVMRAAPDTDWAQRFRREP